jgi:hypothetical protein
MNQCKYEADKNQRDVEAKESTEVPRYSDDHGDSYDLTQCDSDIDSETGDVNKPTEM